MWKIIIVAVLLFLVYSNLDPATQQSILTIGKGIKETAQTVVDVKGKNPAANNQPYVDENNRTVLGPVYQEVGCKSDIECQQLYDCNGCFCDTTIGKCWY